MFEPMWLSPKVIRPIVGTRRFYIEGLDFQDPVAARIYRELLDFFGASQAADRQCADLVFIMNSAALPAERDGAYRIHTEGDCVCIEGNTATALLYGLYGWMRRKACGQQIDDFESVPNQALRMIDHWDQTDGSVERGYAGESIFFGVLGSNSHADFRNFPDRHQDDPFRGDLARVTAYARLLASIGINAIALNNVNVRGEAKKLIVEPYLDRVAVLADIFGQFGIRVFLSVNFASPIDVGGLSTADPLADEVSAWWEKTVADIYQRIPAFGGFLVKADAEGEPGPTRYGRTHVDGANMLARPLSRHGGLVIWRAFVYDCNQDWRDRSLDRAKSAYENFIGLDGLFAENVVLQVKFGPIDFQVSEPANPLIGRMTHTNLMIEFQITAEYLGQQIDVNYVLPQWLAMTNWDTCAPQVDARVKAVVPKLCLVSAHTGFAGVSNVGMDDNWTGNTLAQANLYGFGRMCWDPDATAGSILDEWMTLTFPDLRGPAREAVSEIMLTSNKTFKNYTAPLGVGFMVKPGLHYGVDVNGYEYDRWGTYHFADRDGIGVDRTQSTGTGFTAQYHQALQERFEHAETTPDDLLLFFHHLPYDRVLHDGQTLIQHIYSSHFEGVKEVERYITLWKKVKGSIPQADWENVADRLQAQKTDAVEWRDQINTYFHRMSGVPDRLGRKIYA